MNAIGSIVSQAARLLGDKATSEVASKGNSDNAFEKILSRISGNNTEETAKTAAQSAKDKLTPQGLAAVEARLKAMGQDELTSGQAQALDMISRNIARYQANQAEATNKITAA